MPTIAFATAQQYAALTAEDRLVATLLAQRGIAVQAVVWNDPAVPWRAFDAVVIRSCWDYHTQPDLFAHWITDLERMNVLVWNRPATLLWNMHKTYLRDLQARGAVVSPTVWVERGERTDLQTVLRDHGWERAVVKPTVGATAYHTFSTTPQQAAADNARAAEALRHSGVLVQQFVPNISSAGEWSLIFVGGRYSHAVLKRPKPGDFRVQSAWGGTTEPAIATPDLIGQAEHVVAQVTEPLLYARVDGVLVDGAFVLMELELVEPFLFLETAPPAAATRFAAAIAALFS